MKKDSPRWIQSKAAVDQAEMDGLTWYRGASDGFRRSMMGLLEQVGRLRDDEALMIENDTLRLIGKLAGYGLAKLAVIDHEHELQDEEDSDAD